MCAVVVVWARGGASSDSASYQPGPLSTSGRSKMKPPKSSRWIIPGPASSVCTARNSSSAKRLNSPDNRRCNVSQNSLKHSLPDRADSGAIRRV